MCSSSNAVRELRISHRSRLKSILSGRVNSRTLRIYSTNSLRYDHLIEAHDFALSRYLDLQKDLRPPYNFDEYSTPFLPVGERLELQAAEAEAAGNIDKASELFLRAACVYRLGRFPFLLTAKQRYSWDRQKISFIKGARCVI